MNVNTIRNWSLWGLLLCAPISWAEEPVAVNIKNSPLGKLDGLVMAAGGLPIQAGGEIYGAVGVSGAPSGAVDEACAAAGIKAVIDELEMGS